MKTLTAAMIAGLSLMTATVSLPVMAQAAAPASALADAAALAVRRAILALQPAAPVRRQLREVRVCGIMPG